MTIRLERFWSLCNSQSDGLTARPIGGRQKLTSKARFSGNVITVLVLLACLAMGGCKWRRWNNMFHRESKTQDNDVTLAASDGGNQIYLVKESDNGFWGIATDVYGHGQYWPLIARANPNVQPNQLRVGQELIIPPLGETQPAFPTAGEEDDEE